MSRGFVLLPGAGLSHWLWAKLIPLLEAPADSFRRLENERPEMRLTVEFAELIHYSVQCIERTHWDDVVLVGHSGAGLIAGAVAKRCPRVRHLVFVAANIPAHGEGALSAFPSEVRESQIRAMHNQAQVPQIPMKAMEATVRQHLANRCSEDDIEFILRQEFLSEPLCVLTESMDWSDFPAVRRTYLICEYDSTLTVEQQRLQAGHLGIEDLRLIPGDHLPMLSCPGLLAEALNSVLPSVSGGRDCNIRAEAPPTN